MTVHPNGTDAKEIALHFLDVTTTGKATPHIIAKTIRQAKSLLASGYTKEEIKKATEYVNNVMNVKMYSIGYLNTCIHKILMDIEAKEQVENVKAELERISLRERNEVNADDESAERNREKARRQQSRVQSRFREKYSLDMLKG